MQLHVVPLNDIMRHDPVACRCNPRMEVYNGNHLVIHRSFDGREAVEQAEELLGIKSDGKKKWGLFEVNPESETAK